jgi:hypothetical protein
MLAIDLLVPFFARILTWVYLRVCPISAVEAPYMDLQ